MYPWLARNLPCRLWWHQTHRALPVSASESWNGEGHEPPNPNSLGFKISRTVCSLIYFSYMMTDVASWIGQHSINEGTMEEQSSLPYCIVSVFKTCH